MASYWPLALLLCLACCVIALSLLPLAKRASARRKKNIWRSQQSSSLFGDLEAARLIISHLDAATGCLPRTCSLARALAYEGVTRLDLRRGQAMTNQEAKQSVQRLLDSGRWSHLEALALPACMDYSTTIQVSRAIAGRWTRLRAFTADDMWHIDNPVSYLSLGYQDRAIAGLMAPWWHQLTTLRLGWMLLGVPGAQCLADARLDNMESLDLQSTELGSDGLLCLLSAPWPKLRSLSLYDNRLDDSALRHLAGASHLSLTCLKFSGQRLTYGAWQHLAGATQLSRLGILELTHNNLEDDAVLASAACLTAHLSYLNLSYNAIGGLALQHLLSSAQLSGLHYLYLDHNQLAPGSLQHFRPHTLLAFTAFPCQAMTCWPLTWRAWQLLLIFLLLQVASARQQAGCSWHCVLDQGSILAWSGHTVPFECATGQDGLRYLAANPMPSLAILKLKSNGISKDGLQLLCKAHLPQLHWLDLADNPLHAAALLEVLPQARLQWPALRRLDVPSSQCMGAAALQKQLACDAWAELRVYMW